MSRSSVLLAGTSSALAAAGIAGMSPSSSSSSRSASHTARVDYLVEAHLARRALISNRASRAARHLLP
ncbi:MAG: hypothetical protein ACYDEY_11330 [Acidimicrobiales bacterium]